MSEKFFPEDESTWGSLEPLGEYSMRPDIFADEDITALELESMGYEKRQSNVKEHFSMPEVSRVRVFTQYRTHTGRTLVDRINAAKPDLVIDAGCGYNYFGGAIKNCIGIDFVDYESTDGLVGPHIVMDINETPTLFKPGTVDFIICIGPFNFGPESQIKKLLNTFKYLLKPDGVIIGHLRPGQVLDHERSAYRGYHHMPWTTTLAHTMFKENGLNISWIGEEATDLRWMTDDHLARHLETWKQAHISISGPPSSKALDDTLTNNTLERHDIVSNIENEIYRRANDDRYNKDRPYYVRSRIAIELTKDNI